MDRDGVLQLANAVAPIVEARDDLGV